MSQGAHGWDIAKRRPPPPSRQQKYQETRWACWSARYFVTCIPERLNSPERFVKRLPRRVSINSTSEVIYSVVDGDCLFAFLSFFSSWSVSALACHHGLDRCDGLMWETTTNVKITINNKHAKILIRTKLFPCYLPSVSLVAFFFLCFLVLPCALDHTLFICLFFFPVLVRCYYHLQYCFCWVLGGVFPAP